MSRKDKVVVWGGFGEKKSNSGRQYYLQDRIYDSDGLCPALSTYKSDYWIIIFGDKDEDEEDD